MDVVNATAGEATSVARDAATARSSRAGRLLFRGLVLVLVGANAWLMWPAAPDIDPRQVDAWIAQGETGKATVALRDRLRRCPLDGGARMRLSRLLAKQGKYLECARQLHEVPYWWPDKGEALFLEAQAFKLVNRGKDAEAAWRACTVDDPLHPISPSFYNGAARELVAHLLLEGRFAEARELLWTAYKVTRPSDHVGVLSMRTAMELERISHEESLATLRKYAEADPTDWDARRALALEEQQARREAAADEQIRACLKARPDDPAVWRARLDLLYQRGDRDAIRSAVKQLPPGSDADPELWKFRGLAREWDNDMPGAAEAFRKAAELNPAEAEYLYKLGVAEQRTGQAEKGREHVRRSQEMRSAFSKFHDAYYEFLDVYTRAKPGDPAFDGVVERLAAACDVCGWTREAAAWRTLIAGGSPTPK